MKKKFLAQSYIDAVTNYYNSLENPNSSHWDYVFITASNQSQAASYETQLEHRREEGKLCSNTKFVVLPDIGGNRIGSGGATLNILKYLYEQNGEDMYKKKVLVLHSGGDSKRIPQYSAVGKLFSPVPRELENGEQVTIFDDLLIMCSGLPDRIGYGMLVLSGDTDIVFNPLQIDLKSVDAAGISIKTSVEEGTDHGVFLSDDRHIVTEFLHKQPEVVLREKGAVDSNNNIDIDTGTIWFSKDVCRALFELISEDGKLNIQKYCDFVNDTVCLSLYADFLPPLATETTLDQYMREIPEKEINNQLIACRKKIWSVLHPYMMRVVRLIPAEYLHFGSTWEMYRLLTENISKYDFLGWKKEIFTNSYIKGRTAIYSSYISEKAVINDKCWIEYSDIEAESIIGEGAIVSGVRVDGQHIPDGVVLHGFKLKNGKYIVRIYGVNDNPKNGTEKGFLGHSLNELMHNAEVDEKNLCEEGKVSIWNARLFPECDSIKEAVDAAINLKKIIDGTADTEMIRKWKNAKRYSLETSFNFADVDWIINRQNELIRKVKVARFVDDLKTGVPIYEALCTLGKIDYTVAAAIELIAQKTEFPLNVRIIYALSYYAKEHDGIVGGIAGREWEDKAYEIVKKAICGETFKRFKLPKKIGFVKNEQIVKMPVRVNFCGSPSDAAPYCLEHGGTMLDGTLLLNDKYPIEITVKKLSEPIIVFGSKDLKEEREYSDIREIQYCYNTDDTFALHKAVLIAMGIIPEHDDNQSIADICNRLGGGLYLSTSAEVPKGSGLGTSSIIAAGCIKAINLIMGREPEEEAVYAQVFAVEQLMSTGGGWQDQVGGYDHGIKYFTTMPGKYQKIKIERVDISDEAFKELSDRFCLIFSGQRRLAKNVLREEMNQTISNDPQIINSVQELQELCALMKFYLEKGDITEFGKCITKQFEIVKTIDKGSSNACIEYIFDICNDLIDGKAICGAGGGGFLQVILKKGVSKEMLANRIESEFADCGVSVWKCNLLM